jgi:ubiquinone/menaquinone biosynthesis C-methylase UbiE
MGIILQQSARIGGRLETSAKNIFRALDKHQLLAEYINMSKKRTPWTVKEYDYHDYEKYFEFFDLSLRQHYTDAVETILGPKHIEGKVLDLGCGFGILGMRICSQDEFSAVVGLEQSRTLVKAAEIITSRRGYSERIAFRVWEDDFLPFESNEFDAVVSFMALHKWNNLEKVFSEIERVRKRDGIVYIGDFRRDQSAIQAGLFLQQTRFEMGKDIADDLKRSFKSAYVPSEVRDVLDRLALINYRLEESRSMITITTGLPDKGEKQEPLTEENKVA